MPAVLAVSCWFSSGVASLMVGTPTGWVFVTSVPVKPTVLFPPLVKMFSVAVLVPAVAPVRKLIDTRQDSSGNTGSTHPVGWLHEAAFVPVLVRLVTSSGALPEFVTSTVFVMAEVLRFRIPQARDVGDTPETAISGPCTVLAALNTVSTVPCWSVYVTLTRSSELTKVSGGVNVALVPFAAFVNDAPPLVLRCHWNAQRPQPVAVSDLADVDRQQRAGDRFRFVDHRHIHRCVVDVGDRTKRITDDLLGDTEAVGEGDDRPQQTADLGVTRRERVAHADLAARRRSSSTSHVVREDGAGEDAVDVAHGLEGGQNLTLRRRAGDVHRAGRRGVEQHAELDANLRRRR